MALILTNLLTPDSTPVFLNIACYTTFQALNFLKASLLPGRAE